MSAFKRELEALINRHSQENGSDTPDFILARFLTACLAAWNRGVRERECWYGRELPAIANPTLTEIVDSDPEQNT